MNFPSTEVLKNNHMKLLNFSELSRHVTKGDRNAIRPSKIPKKWWKVIDYLIYNELPAWWEQKKKELNK